MLRQLLVFASLLLFSATSSYCQEVLHDSVYNSQKDIIDVFYDLTGKQDSRTVTDSLAIKRLHFSAVPAVGYTLQTGFAGIISSNLGFYADKTSSYKTNVSNINASITYSQRHQVILPVLTNIWTRNNLYNVIGDWKYIKYPSYTYGLGGHTTPQDEYTIDFSAVKLHQGVLRKLYGSLYAGIGYSLDYFWDIHEIDPPSIGSDFENYGLTNTSISSGITFHVLYDDRKNPIKPESGNFASVTFRNNAKALGSDNNWQSLQIDARKYIPFPATTKNVLAFWTYDWFTTNGTPPYLMLPSTGNDPASNLGRGYIQGRYRSSNLLYLESEYRFSITSNGLLGGVVFANLQSVSEMNNGNYQLLAPGYGAGLRIKTNKFSRTNLCIDYALGRDGSRGFFVNLGEVF